MQEFKKDTGTKIQYDNAVYLRTELYSIKIMERVRLSGIRNFQQFHFFFYFA